jgi:hypothetical protein
MNRLIVLKYMDKLTKEDINKYALSQDVSLKSNELDLLYAYIKKYSRRILNEPLDVIDEIKDDLSDNVYNKLLELYDKYKDFIDKLK